jgi:hypothetical protein
MNKRKQLHYFILSIISLTALVGFFLLIDPEGKPLVYIFIPVVLIWIVLYSIVQVVTLFFFNEKNTLRSILTVVGVSTIVLLLLLSGVDQLTIADIILSMSLVFVTSFYFYRMWN